MTEQEARQILGISEKSTWEEIVQVLWCTNMSMQLLVSVNLILLVLELGTIAWGKPNMEFLLFEYSAEVWHDVWEECEERELLSPIKGSSCKRMPGTFVSKGWYTKLRLCRRLASVWSTMLNWWIRDDDSVSSYVGCVRLIGWTGCSFAGLRIMFNKDTRFCLILIASASFMSLYMPIGCDGIYFF